MTHDLYEKLILLEETQETLPDTVCLDILESPQVRLLPLLDAAFVLRQKSFGRDVLLHILNNVQNGHCPEDCQYCAQSKGSAAKIEEYGFKTDEEILAEAEKAYRSGAFRHCMVFSGRTPSLQRIEHLAELIKRIKAKYPMQICVSPGILDRPKARILKEAGVNRINHNLNTSRRFYPSICTTHTYEDRIKTLDIAQGEGLEICSGIIVGMGEESRDIIEVARYLRKIGAQSIPVNFYIPIEGNVLKVPESLTPEYCLRVLCLFRFLNPSTDIRIAAGREFYLKEMEPLALYPANSLFLSGYLNVRGAEAARTLRMIQSAGFSIRSDFPLKDLLDHNAPLDELSQNTSIELKQLSELRPAGKDTPDA